MDSRKQKKCHPFPRQLSGRIDVLGDSRFPVCLIHGDSFSVLVEVGISATAGEIVRGLRGLVAGFSRYFSRATGMN